MANYPIRRRNRTTKSSFLGDGKVAVGVTLGVIFTVIGSMGISLWTGVIATDLYSQVAPIMVSLIVAGTSTFIAANALLEQRRTREAGTDPVLIAHFGQREDAREVITFSISNVGAGAALNVCLEVKSDVGTIDVRRLFSNIFRQHRPFAVIAQNSSIQFDLGVGHHLIREPSLPPFVVILQYEDLDGCHYESTFQLDLREMELRSASLSVQMRGVLALEAISKRLQK